MAKAFLTPIRSKGRKALLSDINSIARQEVQAAMDRRVKPALVKSHEAVVRDWEHKPEFRARLVVRANEIAVYVFPAGEHKLIWIYVDQGTKPHKIRAKNAPWLMFKMHTVGGKPVRGGYVPKTMAKPARTVQGGGYVKQPSTLVKLAEVDHPGSEGRGFTKQIARDIEPAFRKEIDAAFKRAARRINGGG